MAVQRMKVNAYSCSWYFFLFISSLRVIAVTANVPAKRLLKEFGTNYSMNAAQTANLFDKMGISSWDYDGSEEERCSSSAYFHKEYSKNGVVDESALEDFCPAVLYELSKDACQRELKEEEEEGGGNEDAGKAWGFGFLFVTVISVGSLLGAVVVPIMHKKIFQTVLMSMISLAVGVLSGSGIFHLIPHALELSHEELSYLWKLVMVAVGIYVFFLLECIMKMFLYFKALESDPNANKTTGHGIDNYGHYLSSAEPGGITHVPETFPVETDEKKPNGVGATQEKKQFATVAWMIIIGDGLHNFIDGLAIGVSCSTSVLSGLSTSLAICCEELPHELGDFAILLNSGMTYKQAMVANFGSACLCYVGLIVGLILGFETSAVHYIYGIAGGMFLYISLVDMLPESIQMIHGLAGKSKKRGFKLLFIQSFFILFGMGAMLLLSFYAHKIEEAKW